MEIKSNLIEAHIIRIKNNEIEFLLLKRSSNQKYPDVWQMVTGRIEQDEKAYETVVREIKEETSLSLQSLYIVPNINSFYDSIDDSISLIPVFVGVVESDSEVIISHEHQSFKWTNKKSASKLLTWPGQSKSVEIICDYFGEKKGNLNFIEIELDLL